MPLNPIEEEKFAALRKNCRDLGVPAPPEIHIGFEVKDKNGILLFEDKQRGHSWTRNFYNSLIGMLFYGKGSEDSTFGAGHIQNAKDTAGTVRKDDGAGCIWYPSQYYTATSAYNSGAGSDDNGILVGSGNTAFSVEQYKLATDITHGTSVGNLSYAATEAHVFTYDSTADAEKWETTLKRVFNNNSGASITVSEIGLIGKGRFFYTGDAYYMTERSVLDPTVTVPDGAQLTVSYDISMDFSAID